MFDLPEFLRFLLPVGDLARGVHPRSTRMRAPRTRSQVCMSSIRFPAFGLVAAMAAGCGSAGVGDGTSAAEADSVVHEPTAFSAVALPNECRPDGSPALDRMYAETEASLDELIGDGGLLAGVSYSLKLMIFSSNQDLVDETARQELDEWASLFDLMTEPPLEARADGTWVAVGSGTETVLRFVDPMTGQTILENPFALDSYLRGVVTHSSHDWEEMKRDPSLPVEFTFEWSELGPLSYLLADGGAVPNPIVVTMSLLELGGDALGYDQGAAYGAFASVQTVLLESSVEYRQKRGAFDVQYLAHAPRISVQQLNDSGRLPFTFEKVHATDGSTALLAEAQDVVYLNPDRLSGSLRYSLVGDSLEGITVVSDFGDGQVRPTVTWSCTMAPPVQ